MTRAGFLRAGAAAALLAAVRGAAALTPPPRRRTMIATRTIPSSGEALPVVGCGTWRTFDVGTDESERAPLAATLAALFDAGGSVVDSSPMYGRAEAVVGDLVAASDARARAFLATKVWTHGRDAGAAQMRESLRRLRTDHVDLMQVHNLVDWRTHLPVLRDWKAQGRIRYVGVTHYAASAYAELESVLRGERIDFVQVNYSLEERAAERRILPLAAERGVAVAINRPFGSGSLFAQTRGRPLPDWAAEFGCASWAQLFLKFVLGHPAVTCAIPGTRSAEHMLDDAAAGTGAPLDAAARRRLLERWNAL
ncbi:MAG TPA: aldo/keto reductase [Dokdonella sp.]